MKAKIFGEWGLLGVNTLYDAHMVNGVVADEELVSIRYSLILVSKLTNIRVIR